MVHCHGLFICIQLVTVSLLTPPLIHGVCGFPPKSWQDVKHEDKSDYRRNNSSVPIGIKTSSPPILATRADIWSDSVEAGAKLNALMRNGRLLRDQQSAWTDFNEIEKYGWRAASGGGYPSSPNPDEITSAQPVMDGLHIPALTDDSWKVIDWEHSEASRIQNKYYPASNAKFRALYNAKHNIIIATSSESPAGVEDPLPEDKRVPLQHWSDIIYLTWMKLCKAAETSPHGLRYIVRLNIINIEAHEILEHIAGTSMEEYKKPFPGDIIKSPESFNAVVGFPLGRSVANLLIQHKDLGKTRFIQSVQFWDSYDGKPKSTLPGLEAIPNMLYTIS